MNPRSHLPREMIRDDSRVAREEVDENMRAADDVTAQVSAEVIVRNADGHTPQSGAEIAVRMTKYSAANIKAIVKSNIDRAEVTRTCRATGRVLARKASSMVLTGSDVCCNTACLRILSIFRNKSCVAVLMP